VTADPATEQRPAPSVVVVGSASRDLTSDDPRGWRLGGGVTYGALALARLGIRTAALVGLDRDAIDAPELDLLRSAGVDVVPVLLAHAPVFVNAETPAGRVQTAVDVSEPLPVTTLPAAWRASLGWLFAPVAGELPEEWAGVPAADATVALGWQGLLRTLVAGRRVEPRAPWPSALLARADLIGVSLHDLPPAWPLQQLDLLCRPGAELVLTAGHRGGALFRVPVTARELIRYPSVRAAAVVDATGAGDVTLTALLAARVVHPASAAASEWTASRRRHLLVAAAAASLTVQQHGVNGVPDLAAIRDLLAARNAESQSA
jgi:sugar/nucleoside kinase (ribokinase family)